MLTLQDSEMQKQSRAALQADMKRRLAKKPELIDKSTITAISAALAHIAHLSISL